MSDVGIFPPGMMVWLGSLLWCSVCALGVVAFLLLALWRTSERGGFSRDPFTGYAIGFGLSGVFAGFSMWLINWYGSQPGFARWLDRPWVTASWLLLTIALAPAVAFAWNRSRSQPPT